MLLRSSATGHKERFTPLNPPRVTLYVCGITPYDYAHIGHGRCYVVFDVLYRLLTQQGYTVSYCRNFTDIDDKLLARAEREFGDKFRYRDVAQRFIDAYHDDMAQLNCLPPDYEPRVTQVIPDIISFIQGLIDAGYAYEVDNSVYFSVDQWDAYGTLSHRELEEQKAGARVAAHEGKRNPLDFALWKADVGFFESPWGEGRPGWHIECSVMAYKYAGKTIDIHGGGMDLLFPHHENECAQSEALHGAPFVRYWMHNAFVRIDKEKMSKSLGNFFTLRDVFATYDPMIIRYMFLTHHYRSPLDFSWDDINACKKAYARIVRTFESVELQPYDQSDYALAMIEALTDDLNVPGALGVLFDALPALKQDMRQAGAVKRVLVEILGLTLEALPDEGPELTPALQELIDERERARQEKNWKRADELRDQLRELGYEVQDKKRS